MSDVGSIGEQQFALWCEQAGLTASPPSRDRYGWDFVVQFPPMSSSSPLDERPAQLKCMVQVKSTSRGTRRAKIKLDNWERMINDPLPWFVCAIVFENTSVSELFLVHVDRQHTERILRELRALRISQPNAELQLHETTLDVTWKDEDLVSPATPAALRDALMRHIGTDAYEYGQTKREWFQSVGYDDHPRTITAHIKADSPDELWAQVTDFSLGLSNSLPMYLQTVVDERFGMPVTQLDLSHCSTEDQLGHVSGPVPSTSDLFTLAISNEQRSSLTLFRCEVFHSATFHAEIPENFRKIRFASPLIEVIMDEPPAQMPKQFPVAFGLRIGFPPLSRPAEAIPLADIGKIARALKCMAEAPQNGLRIELRHPEASWLLPGDMRDMQAPHYAAPMSELFEQALAIAFAFGLDADVLVSPESIFAQELSIRVMRDVLLRPQNCFPTLVPLSKSDSKLGGQMAAILLAVGVAFGEHRVVGAFALCGVSQQQTLEDGTPVLSLPEGEVRRLWTEIVPATGWSPQSLMSRFEEVKRDLLGSEFAHVMPPSLDAVFQLVGVALEK